MGMSDIVESVLLDASTWADIEALGGGYSGSYVLGLDLSRNASMSAAAYSPDARTLDAFAVLPETPSLVERGLRDGVGKLYQDCANRGELIQAGHMVSDIGEP